MTPSAGCLCVDERWSPADGRLESSDQVALLNAFRAAGGDTGYLVVVDIDARAAPVELDDVRSAIERAEQAR